MKACSGRGLMVLTALSVGLLAMVSIADAAERKRPYEITEEREACTEYAPLRRPLFGDTHVHTAYSFDASTQDTRNTPRDAYRFARGARMGIQPYDESGKALRTIQLSRPLDWTAVTDHAELLGEVNLCMTPDSSAYNSTICWIHRNWPNVAFQLIAARGMILKQRWGICGENGELCKAASGNVWQEILRASEEAYDRSSACGFTSFVAYEWTATMGMGRNLHRNVIFRNEKVPPLPVSWLDTPSVSDLWKQLQEKCVDGIVGCDVLTIPHNSNLSAGLMFKSATHSDFFDAPEPISAEEAAIRTRWEPLWEIMQHKGDSECFYEIGSADESCAFEELPYDRFGAKFNFLVPVVKAGPSSYLRWALKEGLRLEQTLGANPFKAGIVAATDTHIAAPGLVDEKGHPGHGGAGKGAQDATVDGFADDLEFNPGGLSVVWAEENTRDSIFAAMTRKEAYGTSGPRHVVRFFGGWKYPESLCGDPDFAAAGYAGGVPMGGDLPARPKDASGAAPKFALWAMQDPGPPGSPGMPLQRMQVIKGWVKDGELHEEVIDVAGGDSGASVDLDSCTPKGEGASQLCTVWTDPDFDPSLPAFYYGRILENPTCRWSQYVCNAANVRCDDASTIPESLAGCCAEEHRPIIQERTWTSPIWYTP